MADVLTRFNSLPCGPIGIIAMKGCEEIVNKIDKYLVKWRTESTSELKNEIDLKGYIRDSYQIPVYLPRFGSGEAKGVIQTSVRGMDLYIVCDCFNYGVTYKMYGQVVPMSPDDHFADLKRIIAAAGGHAKRITVVMPMLYEGRQHKRSGRESLDCALALQELAGMGVENIITFDAHDPRVSNAIPLKSFENVATNYQMIKALIREVPDIKIDKDHLTIISPDEGGLGRCIYYSSVLELELGMFYKRRDYSQIVDGRNKIISHEYLGSSLEGKDVIIVDDMISSGDSMIDVAKQLKARNANRVFICSAFGLFCNGLETFDEAYEQGLITKVLTTNTIYRTEELKSREWYGEVDMSKYISYIVEILNHDASIESIIDTKDRIKNLLIRKGYKSE
ncbi:MAG: ribose-phosphate pyrophosphokinase [Clostridia bacterium]|jgi:ribose-phosphate pyrophosphokinase|nr:ribose-phosphate pyrophosphokinase [Clostridia bacterium]